MSAEPGRLDEDERARAGEEHLVEQVEQARERLRASARAAMGITGRDEEAPPLRRTLARSGVGWYPLVALGLLVIVDQFQGYAFSVLAPEISRGLGVDRSVLVLMVSLGALALTGASLPMAALVQRKARRALVAVVTGFGWSLTTLFTGMVTSVWAMLGVQLADGVTGGSVLTVHTPLLVDSYPPEARVRVLGFYRAIGQVSDVSAPLLVAVLTGWYDLTWRGVFVVMGIICIAVAMVSVRLRDPGFGRWDASKVREVARSASGATGPPADDDEEVSLGFFEIVRRLLMIPTLRRLYGSLAVLGMFVIPLGTYLSFFLEEEWGLGPTERALFFALMPLFSIVTILSYARRAEAIYRDDPARLLRVGAAFFAASIVSLVASVRAPVFSLMVLLFGVSTGLIGFLLPAFNVTSLGIIPPRMRPHSSALAGMAVAGVGGIAGAILLGGIDRRYGTVVAITVLAVPGLVAAALLYRAAETVDADLNRTVDDLVEEQELANIRAAGGRLPLLACRGLDFAYGPNQVLFGVDLSVDEGEMVALLGTNGAGKSTLLRVIAGLGLPMHGSVRLHGHDLTFVDPERRVELGIMLIPGGRPVFSSLSVVENLRVFATMHGRDRAAVNTGIEAAFDAFPALVARRNQAAATLSGGEQQMLSVAQALVVKPRLLLIDELSLGLAPKVVAELLEIVRRLNEGGMAIVLVEQSVTLALSLVDRACFMEKGTIRFDGRATELAERRDLARSVFLAGALGPGGS